MVDIFIFIEMPFFRHYNSKKMLKWITILFKDVETEGSKVPNREYSYYFIKLGELYFVKEWCKEVKKKEITIYEFTNNESFAFPFDTEFIAKQTAEECGGNIVEKKATFEDYVRQGQRWGHYIDRKKKNLWRIYTVK